ncbi:mediator complex subunit SOH1 [Rhodotorula paludigena]|uniref:mediator complex subunit SOH1 n=1 Tax=Rhodotorula paludigena TaxID=86838 RepID=UPI0031715273
MASVAAVPVPAPAAPTPEQRTANRIRFETELEFVSSLANPFYLQSLAQQGLFDSEPFLNYLTYLLYFREPRYARFLQYPQCLHHLSLLTAPGAAGSSFRRALKDDGLLAQEWAGKMVAHWAGWREGERAQEERMGINDRRCSSTPRRRC